MLHPLFEAFDLIMWSLFVVLAGQMLSDYIQAVSRNGNVLRRKVEVWGAIVFLGAWITMGRFEKMTDFIPGVDLVDFTFLFIWIPLGALNCALARCWYELHMERNKEPKP